MPKGENRLGIRPVDEFRFERAEPRAGGRRAPAIVDDGLQPRAIHAIDVSRAAIGDRERTVLAVIGHGRAAIAVAAHMIIGGNATGARVAEVLAVKAVGGVGGGSASPRGHSNQIS